MFAKVVNMKCYQILVWSLTQKYYIVDIKIKLCEKSMKNGKVIQKIYFLLKQSEITMCESLHIFLKTL